MSVKVSKVPSYGWVVTCSTCEGRDFFSTLIGWARAESWSVAWRVAVWHAQMHREQTCPTCLHQPPISRPEPIGNGLFKHEGRTYTVLAHGVREMRPTREAK